MQTGGTAFVSLDGLLARSGVRGVRLRARVSRASGGGGRRYRVHAGGTYATRCWPGSCGCPLLLRLGFWRFAYRYLIVRHAGPHGPPHALS